MILRRFSICAIIVIAGGLVACGETVRSEKRLWAYDSVEIGNGPAPGPEDVAKGDGGLIWVSSTDRRSDRKLGGLYSFNARAATPELKPVAPSNGQTIDAALRPHGVDYFRRDDERRLFVIDHSSGKEGAENIKICASPSRVLIYKIDSKGNVVDLVKIIQNDNINNDLINPNDIAGVGVNAFYITNLFGENSCAEFNLLLFGERGYVSYFDGAGFHRIYGAGRMPNGVAVDWRDGSPWRLYVSSSLDETVTVFDISENLAVPTLLKKIRVEGVLDNIHVLPDGSLLVASHPSTLRFFLDAKLGLPGPSKIYRVEPESEKVEIVFENAGGLVAAASSAALDVDESGVARLAVGAVFQPQPVLLKLRTPPWQGAE